MNDSRNKNKQARSGIRKQAPAEAGSVAPAPAGVDSAASAPAPEGLDGDATAPLAKVAPKGAVKENSAAVRTAAVSKPMEKAEDRPDAKARKPKLVRGSFALPKDEYAALAELKKTCQNNGVPVKKSQLLRVAIALLRDLDQARLGPMIAVLPATKRVRAKKGK